MEIYRALGVSRLVELMAAHRKGGGSMAPGHVWLAEHEPDLVATAEGDRGFRFDEPSSRAGTEPCSPWLAPPIINGN
jgi:hypothetical protein